MDWMMKMTCSLSYNYSKRKKKHLIRRNLSSPITIMFSDRILMQRGVNVTQDKFQDVHYMILLSLIFQLCIGATMMVH